MATLTGGTIRWHSCLYISGAPQLFNISFPSAHAHTQLRDPKNSFSRYDTSRSKARQKNNNGQETFET